MNEHFDLTEILKDCPEGTKFYSTIFGDVEFMCIANIGSCSIVLKARDEYKVCVDSEGKYLGIYNGECILFPSREQRSWSKFTAPWYKKEKLVELKESDDEKIRRWIIDDIRYNMNNEPLNNSEYKKKAEKAIAWLENQGEQNLPSANERAWLYLVSDVLTWKDGIGQYLDDPRVQELAKRLCSEYSQKLYIPSVLSNSSNTAKNERKFDPKTLQPFDRVLASVNETWRCDLFSHHAKGDYKISILIGLGRNDKVIPYNEETKHLVGTTEESPEFYRYWED